MKIAIVQRYKLDQDGDGIYYVTEDNRKMFESYGAQLLIASDPLKAQEMAEECDLLCVPGGVDVDPKFYGEELNGSEKYYTWMDELDMAYIKAFYEASKPILGICRGHQILNVCFGGSLHQDIKGHRNTRHEVSLKEDSFIRKIYDEERIKVNSLHHQAIKDLAPGFKAVAMSDDGYVEAMEKDKIYSIQWHPEMYDGEYFIKNFIEKVLKAV